MRKNTLFSKIFFILLIIFLLFNLLVWNISVKNSLTGGDLARMSYKSEFSTQKIVDNILEPNFINSDNYNGEEIDLITIGDSFSNSLDIPYQKFISKEHNIKVLNINKIKNTKNYLEIIYLLLNSGFLAEKKVKYIIVESVQREAIQRFTKNINSSIKTEEKILDLMKIAKNNYNQESKSFFTFINNLNQNAFLYTLLYPFDDNAFFSKVYKSNLNESMFSHPLGKDTLLFYKDDIKSIRLENDKNINLLNSNMNELALSLQEHKIKLIFMPAVNKLNLYSEYLKNNKYPQSIFFEKLRTLEKKYQFIDTKKILKKEINKGTLDIFYLDDTHWSHKASKAIINEINFE